ncbi:cbb3-type cytochrome oxidase assembly protein CcoS [Candidatus Thioglobus sp.]|uniref:cbb3-type cytochrome oxidase assembly protein CcoS n=1 Tax=Candidatus Thioglobus sp. TaxID=2026721 RepID=UPI003242DF79
MDVIYWLIPSMIFVGAVLVILLMMGVKNGQFDDLEGEGQRILYDEDEDNSETEKKFEKPLDS